MFMSTNFICSLATTLYKIGALTPDVYNHSGQVLCLESVGPERANSVRSVHLSRLASRAEI